MFEVRGLNAHYGRLAAVRDVSFTVGPNSIVCILGPNGAGKSTLLKTIAGLLSPSTGRVSYCRTKCSKVLKVADYVHVMREGKLAISGTPSEVDRGSRLMDAYFGTADPGDSSNRAF